MTDALTRLADAPEPLDQSARIAELETLLARSLVFDHHSAEDGLDALGGWHRMIDLVTAYREANPLPEAAPESDIGDPISGDDGALWRKSPELACEVHMESCNAVWDELERQVTIADGAVPVLEHPSATKVRRAAQMRGEIIDSVLHAVTDALDDLRKGIAHGEEDE